MGMFDDLIPAAGNQPASRAPVRLTVRPQDANPVEDAQSQAAPVPGTEPARGAVGPSQVDAFILGAARGVTADWLDELAGIHAAGAGRGRGAAASPLAMILGAGRLGYETIAGRGGATEDYEASRDAVRQSSSEASDQFPGTTLAGQFVGGAAVPVARVAQGATWAGRALNAAVSGGLTGAAVGAGQGDSLGERAVGAGVGAGIGAVSGAVAAPLIEGATGLARGMARPVINAYRGLTQTDAQAARMIGNAHLADERGGLLRGGNRGLTEAEFDAAQAAGSPVVLADRGDSNTQALARWAANVSPNARTSLERVTSDRFGEQTDRASEFVRTLVRTPANAHLTRDALEDASRTTRSPFYNRAFKDGRAGILDDEMMDFSQAPAMRDAIKAATVQLQNRSARDVGRVPPDEIATRWMSPQGRPTLEFWDLVKRQLDQSINVAKREGRREDVMEMDGLRTFLLNKLDAAFPNYPTARGVAAELFKASNALEAGEMFVSSTLKNETVRRAVAKMQPEERDLFAEGFVSKFIEAARERGDRTNILNKIMASPAARERFEIALGTPRMNEMMAFLRTENIMDRLRAALGNSTTARQLMEATAIGGGDLALTGGDISHAASTGGGWLAMRYALRQGSAAISRQVNQRVAERIGDMLSSSDQSILRRGVALASRNPAFMRLLEAADTATARVIGQESTKAAPRLQGSVPATAQDEQQ